jgi:hypothetical protein
VVAIQEDWIDIIWKFKRHLTDCDLVQHSDLSLKF